MIVNQDELLMDVEGDTNFVSSSKYRLLLFNFVFTSRSICLVQNRQS